MDTDRQIRLNFLDEAEKYFDQIESNLLGLASKAIDPQQLDLMLRAAHSVKGAAGMMGFGSLGKVAHRLEDFLKSCAFAMQVIRSRWRSKRYYYKA